jgi:RNA polymerase sigma factor (sigma-70 family)
MTEANRTLVEQLFAEHRGALQTFFYRRALCRSDARDLAQEVYLRMLRIPDIDLIRNPEAYLFTVASNLAKEHAVKERRHGVPVDVNDAVAQEQLTELPNVDGQIDIDQRIARLREVLRQLSPKCCATLVLQYQHGLSYEEIGERLGISANMVKKYLSQALEHCRRRMARLA